MKKRRWICLALTAALTIGMLAGCGQKKDLSDGGEKKKLQKVTLNEVAHSIFYAPMYVAIEEGYFRSVYKELHADHETGAADNK